MIQILGSPLFLKFCKQFLRSGHSISTCPDKKCTKPQDKPNFQKQTFYQPMKAKQNIPYKKVTSNIMTGKQLPFSYRSKMKSRDKRELKYNNSYNSNSRTQSPKHSRDVYRFSRLFSRNRVRNVRNYIKQLLDKEQTDDTTSHIENFETQNVSRNNYWNNSSMIYF